MATTDGDPNKSSPAFVHTSASLRYAVTHVFLPVQLPEESDYTPENDHLLARAVCAAAHAYSTHVCGTSEQVQWKRITRMLDNLQASVQSEHMDSDQVISQLQGMQTGSTLAVFPSRCWVMLTIPRYPCILHPASKCRSYLHETGKLHSVRSIRGFPKQRYCRDDARASDMLVSWVGRRDT